MAFAMSILKLHLQYRLLISEMNSDINVLRILDDYLRETVSLKSESEKTRNVEYFKNNFYKFRKEIDDLRDKMHEKKMKLLALSKENKSLDYKIFKSDNHNEILKQFKLYRKNFDKIKKEFTRFVEKKP